MLQTRRFTFRHECGRSYTHQGFAYSGARADSIGPANSATSERAIHRCSRKKAVTRPERWFYSIWTITIQQRQPDRERPKRLGARTRRPEIHPEPAQKHHHREPRDDEGGERVAGVEGEEGLKRAASVSESRSRFLNLILRRWRRGRSRGRWRCSTTTAGIHDDAGAFPRFDESLARLAAVELHNEVVHVPDFFE